MEKKAEPSQVCCFVCEVTKWNRKQNKTIMSIGFSCVPISEYFPPARSSGSTKNNEEVSTNK